MQGEPPGAALLDIAEQTITEKILPKLDGEARIAALMVASAMRMVARELAQSDKMASASAQLAELALASVDAPSATQFVRAIRDGRCDADTAVHHGLWALASIAASIAKPSILSRVERDIAGLAADAR